MDFYELPGQVTVWLDAASNTFQRVPGSAVLIRYVRSSYQNDPVRSAIELILVIFFIRYLLSPSYSTSKQNFIKLSEDVSTWLRSRPACCLIALLLHARLIRWFLFPPCRKLTSSSMNGPLNRLFRL